MRLTLGKIGWGVVGTLFLMTPLWASTATAEGRAENTPTYNWAYAEEASELLVEIKGLSTQLAEDSHYLDLHSRWNQLNWKSHASHLEQIRTDINAMGERLQRLQDIYSMIAPWQQEAVDRITPKAAALATQTEAAIGHLNEYQGRTWTPSYGDPVRAMSDHAEEIRVDVRMFLDYANTSDQLKGLEKQIEFAGA